MDNEKITNIYLKANKKKRIYGSKNTMNMLMPYIIMNVCCQLHYKKISKISCCFNLKKIEREWGRTYTKFNHAMLCLYNEDQKDYIIDKMDSFESYIREDLDGLFEVVGQYLTNEKVPYSHIDVLSTCLICNVLTQSAIVIWEDTYLNEHGKPEKNMDLERIEKLTINFANAYYSPMKDINLNGISNVKKYISKLCKTIVDWISYDLEQEEKNKTRLISWGTWKHQHNYIPEEKKTSKSSPIERALLSYGYELMVNKHEVGMLVGKKTKEVVEEIINNSDDVTSSYEYVYYGSQSKKKGNKDKLIIFKKRLEEI